MRINYIVKIIKNFSLRIGDCCYLIFATINTNCKLMSDITKPFKVD